MNRMHLKKRRKPHYFLVLIIVLLLTFLLYLYFKQFSFKSNKKYIERIINDSIFIDKKQNYIDNYAKLNINYPIRMIDKALAYQDNYQTFKYMHNEIKPKVYIYNTHPLEKYIGNNTVVEAGKLLKQELEKRNIVTILESKSATDYLKTYKLNYDESYQATRSFLKEQLKNNDFELIIDLHRDALTRKQGLTTINNKDYAKIMFVQNKTIPNYNLALKLNNIIKEKYPTLTRGIHILKVSKLNQDLSPKAILIELGGHNNYFQDVKNTIPILAESIEELLNE